VGRCVCVKAEPFGTLRVALTQSPLRKSGNLKMKSQQDKSPTGQVRAYTLQATR
jgi:hypothetical protein